MLNLSAINILTKDGRILFITRSLRLFAYGFLSVILVLYLAELKFTEYEIGLILTLTLLGDTAVSLWITTRADRIGRKRMLIFGSVLMIAGAVVFALSGNFWLLLVAATIGVISPSGNEVGPFLSIEQASLSHVISNKYRTKIFAWYSLVGSLSTAAGALCVGFFVHKSVQMGMSNLSSYRFVLILYALFGAVLLLFFYRLSPDIEVEKNNKNSSDFSSAGLKDIFGLNRSRKAVFKLAALFTMDSFAGGFVVQSLVAYWFYLRFGADVRTLGAIFFGANLLAGFSALLAAHIANQIGLINTMVFTHLPSNILLILVPFMPNLSLAIIVLLIRFSISQMDVPTRQSYTMAIVSPEERSAAAGITNVARTTGASMSPMIASAMLGSFPLLNFPFYIAGSIKIIYDFLLYHNFRVLHPPEEKKS